jgi:S1-C subfamily serine protease
MSVRTQLFLRSCSLIVALVLTKVVTAQAQTRAELIREAQEQVDDNRALAFFRASINPNLPEPRDSLWSVGVLNLVEILQQRDASLAANWMRWAVRLEPDMAIDSLEFSHLLPVYHDAAEFVRYTSLADSLVDTDWEWVTAGGDTTRARLELGAAAVRDLQVTVERPGVGSVDSVNSSRAALLQPGSYNLVARADGYDSVRVTRELLPGITTVISVELTPLFSEDIAAVSMQKIVRIDYYGVGDRECRTGFFGAPDLVLTTFGSIAGTDSLQLSLSDGQLVRDVRVAAYDVDRDVAVLSVPVQKSDSLAIAPDVTHGQDVWALGYPDCRSAVITRTRVTAWADRPHGRLILEDLVGAGGDGGPLIDRRGAVIGLQSGAFAAVPAPSVSTVLSQARDNVAVAPELLTLDEVARGVTLPREVLAAQPRKRGFPWVVAAVGAAGAAAAVVLLTGGGDEGGQPPTTGGITITFPGS